MANRPARIGVEGETKRHTFREVPSVVDAVRGTADEGTLSSIIRESLREYLDDHGWTVNTLLFGNDAELEAEFMRMTGAPPPSRKRKDLPGPLGDTLFGVASYDPMAGVTFHDPMAGEVG